MKKILFIAALVFISIVTIYSTIGMRKTTKENYQDELNAFFNPPKEVLYFSSDLKKFSLEPNDSNIKYQSLSPIDWIYFQSNEESPLTIDKNLWKTEISIWEWQYIFILNDIFEKYEINWKDYSISQLWKWVFFVNNVPWDYKVYSFNSILNIKLLEKSKVLIDFDLLPSMIFNYDPNYNEILKWADILRISMIDWIYYIDAKSPDIYKKLISSDEKENFVSISIEDIKKTFKKNKDLYNNSIKTQFNDIKGKEYIEKYNNFFQNKSKKNIYYKNIIISNLLSILNLKDQDNQIKDQKTTKYIDAIKNILEVLSLESDEVYLDWINTIKNYYYLAFFGNIVVNESNLEENNITNINNIIKQIFLDKIIWENHFSKLSDILFSYQFSNLKLEDLHKYIDLYLIDLKDKKILKSADSLSFSFFLTQYSIENNEISANSLNIVIFLSEIFNDYLFTMKVETDRFNNLWVQFFNFWKIIQKVNNQVLTKYFEKKNWEYILKPIYIDNFNNLKLWEWVLFNLKNLHETSLKDLEGKKDEYYTALNKDKAYSEWSANNYSLLLQKLKDLKNTIDILDNYFEYAEKLKLNKDLRNIKKIVSVDLIILSKEELIKYLSNFDWVDIQSIKIINEKTIDIDKYYNVSLNIYDSIFNFKLNPDGNIIFDIEIIDSTGKTNNLFKMQSIPLDKKEELYKNAAGSEKDPIKKEQVKFKYFFKNVFLGGFWNNTNSWTTIDNPNDNPNSWKITESIEVSIFKQDELLDWDFTFVDDFIKVPFNSIIVNIVNWKYLITLNKIDKSFKSSNYYFNTELDCNYDFTSKWFSNISLKLLNDTRPWEYMLGSLSVEISPNFINLKDFSTALKNLGYYLEVARKNYTPQTLKIKFDLNLSKVFIDSRSYDVSFSK